MTKIPVNKPGTFTLDLETVVRCADTGETEDVTYAVLREPGKMETRTEINDAQLPWFNALRHLLMAREMGR